MGKRTFPCGHKGLGSFCHRCKQEEQKLEKQKQELTQKKNLREQKEDLFAQDLIDLRDLPREDLVLKARLIIQEVTKTKQYTKFKGKRLNHNRHIISVPLNHDYRLIFRDVDGEIIPEKVMNHEEYNTIKPE